jgi:hypothetical protein
VLAASIIRVITLIIEAVKLRKLYQTTRANTQKTAFILVAVRT